MVLGLVLTASPAQAETVGGAQLASSKRTVDLGPGADPLPEVWAATWLLADAETGEVLAHKGAHVPRAPASTLKMLTALTVLPQTSPDQTYIATRRAADIYGSKVGLRPGKSYTMRQLWNAVFLPSANDAAIAVAEANGGVRRTVRQMNAVAAALGAASTVAKNTNGLDAPGQVSSAYDLALIARAGLKRPDFAGYASRARAQFPDVKGSGTHRIYTTNRMLLSGWPGAIGVKTGFTSRAGRTFVGAATRDGRTLLVSLMGIKETTEGAATKLLSWGFRNADRVTPVGVLVEPEGAEQAVRAATEGNTSTETLPTGATSEATRPTGAADDASASLEPGASSEASLVPAAGIAGLAIAAALALGLLLVRRGTSQQRAPR
jgi:serine-type D-Ala-D-Ala carboxypeptidase (penicillin-binding protein 5/6)